jgi:hypothetical protein
MEFDSQEAFEKSGADLEEDFVALTAKEQTHGGQSLFWIARTVAEGGSGAKRCVFVS